MIQQDAARSLELKQQIKALEDPMAPVAERSSMACQLASIPGYGAICTAELAGEIGTVDHHRKRVPQSQRYYEKKRAEGKRHNQAIRALGRHLRRVIFKMLTQERPYWIDP